MQKQHLIISHILAAIVLSACADGQKMALSRPESLDNKGFKIPEFEVGHNQNCNFDTKKNEWEIKIEKYNDELKKYNDTLKYSYGLKYNNRLKKHK